MKVIVKFLFVLIVFATATDASAQARTGPEGVVTANAPIYLRPDASRTPLRDLPAGTIVNVQETRGDWMQVTFNDAQFGVRLGWIQRRFVSASSAASPAAADKPAATTRPPVDAAKRGQPAPKPQPRRDPLALRGFGSVAFDKALASESFEAVLGTSSIVSFGGGVQVTNLVGGLFAEAAFEWTSDTGERVFVFDGNIYQLGIPVEITQMPIDVAGGWRFLNRSRYTPYVGGGVTFMRYQETSDPAEPGDDLDVQEMGYLAFGGVEIKAARWVHVRAEGRYRQVNNILGEGGVSGEFGETALGGFGGSLKIVIGR